MCDSFLIACESFRLQFDLPPHLVKIGEEFTLFVRELGVFVRWMLLVVFFLDSFQVEDEGAASHDS